MYHLSKVIRKFSSVKTISPSLILHHPRTKTLGSNIKFYSQNMLNFKHRPTKNATQSLKIIKFNFSLLRYTCPFSGVFKINNL